ncbi:MAG: shikimate dehydrogenase [Chloroflexi bacterium]|nr:shikimate dehydrogenase [Chloroflexota bacterium]
MTSTQYELRNTINGKTQLLGIMGWPVSHSFSPAMHNAALADLGLNYVYVPLPVPPDEVATAVSGLATLGFRGVNVTIPHKQTVIPLLDEIEEGAKAIGAVNTIVVDHVPLSVNCEPYSVNRTRNTEYGIRTTGYNTDWSGFLADLAELGVEVNGRDCLILGAGGSARAVAYGLAKSGGRVQVLARHVAQAAKLVTDVGQFVKKGRLKARPLANLSTITSETNAPLIINSTPLGMNPHTSTTIWSDKTPFPEGSFVYDLVYNPTTTTLMQQAQAAGCRTANGLGMLVHQGARAFVLWTGRQPNIHVMRAALTI